MHSALYYPFTGPERESFVKTSLFLWDTVDFIVPFHDFMPRGRSRDETEALEIIARPYVPTNADKKNAHEEFEKICEAEIADQFIFNLSSPERAYNFYPQKLLPETWDLLAESRLAHVIKCEDGVSDASTNGLFGYYMMSVLAVCCSNERKRLVTDNHDPYRTLANIMVDEMPTYADQDDWHGRLISISLNGPDFGDISLKRLVELRKNEDQLLQEMRRSFTATVDETASCIAEHTDNPNIIDDLIKGFIDKTEKDLAELKRALNRSATSLILSKECAFSIATYAASLLASPATGGLLLAGGAVLTAGGLTRGLMSYQDRRRKFLREHPTSWLLAAAGSKIPLT